MIVTTVFVYVKPENVGGFIEASRKNHLGSIEEPGNFRFDVTQCKDDPTKFMLYEAYLSEEAAKAHKGTGHYLKWKETVADWMAKSREKESYNILFPAKK